jgi:hypothetical protein
MEPDGPLPCLQETCTGPYPVTHKSSTYRPILALRSILIIFSRVLVTIDWIWTGNLIIDHSEVVTTNNYNNTFHLHITNHFTLSLLFPLVITW